jgi:hypothetical protein
MKLLLLLILTVGAVTPIRTYPMAPRPLRRLYLESDLVAVVIPGATTRNGDLAFVDLKVRKCIKGKADAESIRVYYEPLVFCPPSAHFPEGRTVLTFLSRAPEGYYRAFACSYSTKTLADGAMRQYEERMAELARMKEAQLKSFPDADVLEWLVKCAEQPATRMEAIYEFRGTPDYPAPRGEKAEPIRLGDLTEGQRGRLVKAFLESKEVDSPAADLAEFLAPVKDRGIDIKLQEGLAKAISKKETFLGDDLMDVLAQRLNIKEWSELRQGLYEWKAGEFGEQFRGYAEESKRLKVLEEALALVGAKLK